MDFSFTEEQNLLRNSLQSMLQSDYDFETHRKVSQGEEGWRRDVWEKFAELGLLAIPFDEKFGGFGNDSTVEMLVVMEELGRFMVTEPYLPSVILAGNVLKGASASIQDQALPELTTGKKIWALAALEPQGRFQLHQVTTKAEGTKLTGHKAAVLGGAWADKFIVSARHSGKDGDTAGIGLYIVDKGVAGVQVHDYPSVDGSRVAELELKDAPAELITEEGYALLSKAVDFGLAALTAESCGVMKALNAATLEYCQTRKQFGVPIASFQVLQHRMVDMFIAYEQTLSMSYMVHLHLNGDDKERAKAAAAAKAQSGKAGRVVGQGAVQLHGGMGVTDELNVGHYFKRLTVMDNLFGNTDYHLKRYSDLTLNN